MSRSGKQFNLGKAYMSFEKDTYYYQDGSILDHFTADKILHRIGKPAVEYSDGGEEWVENGEFGRAGSKKLPCIIKSNGTKFWFKNGKYFRGAISKQNDEHNS